MNLTERRLEGKRVYDGVIVDVDIDRVLLSSGDETIREVVYHPGGAAVLPLDEEGNCWLVEQYRYPLGRAMLEIPAGKLEKGEDPSLCAERELKEETGFTAATMQSLGTVCSSPGISTEVDHLFLAQGLSAGDAQPDELEFLNLYKISFEKAIEMVLSGDIDDAKTVTALLKAGFLLKRF